MVVQWGKLLRLVNFFLMSCINNLSILIWGHVQNINSLKVAMSWLTMSMIHIFYIFLLPLSTITSSGFHPIFTVEIMQKCEDKIEGKRSVAHVTIARTIKPKYFKAWINNLCFCSWKYFFKVWKHLHNSFLKRLHFQILIFDLSQTDITKNGKSRIFSGLRKKT